MQIGSIAWRFRPDGEIFATGSQDRTVRLWDANIANLLRVRIFTGHTGGVNSVAFAPDGQTLITGSPDGTVLLWELTPGSVFE